MRLPVPSLRRHSLTAIAVVVICLLVQSTCAAVLAIDYGTEWTKAALVKPGIPLQIVLTKDTKRKEQSVVSFKKSERLYGTDAFNLGARFPDATYPSLKTLVGRTEQSDVLDTFLRDHPASQIAQSNRSSLTFVAGAGSTYTVEELVAMQLVNIKLQGEKMANEKIKELVLTVPAFWSEQERKAIINAADLAGMKVSTLIHDGLAVAIDYSSTRTFTEEPQYHLIYDMGAGSTTATVVSFASRTIKEGKTNKTIIEIATHGIGFDRHLGGDLFNARIVDHLVDAFRSSKSGAKANTDIKSDGRAFARLFKEASRVKHVLSANTDTTATIESLHEDIDFRAKVSRVTFEEVTSDLVDRVTEPIITALKDANITLEQLDSVILHGGSVRVPFVQKSLEDAVGTSKIAKTVNADEAAVMGAIFRGAQLNNQFRVKDIRSKDYSIYPITITANASIDGLSGSVLFPARTKLGYTKSLIFKTSNDVSFTLAYPSSANLPDDISRIILTANISGVPEKIEKLKGTNECHDPTVKVNIKLTDSGLVNVLHSEVTCEIREKKNLADKFKGFFGGSGKDKEEKKDDQIVFEMPKEERTTKTTSAEATSTAVDTSEKVRFEKAALRVSVNDESPTYLSTEQKLASRKLLREMDQLDHTRAAREEALNSLEAYIYRSRDFLDDDLFQQVSSENERKSFKEKLSAASEWLFSSDSSTLEDFKSKLTELTNIEGPISQRKADYLARPHQIELLQSILTSTKEFLKTSRQVLSSQSPPPLDEDNLDDDDPPASAHPSASLFKLDEKAIETLDSVVEDVESWLTEKLAAQEKLELWEEPVLLLKDLDKKSNQIQSALRKIIMDSSKQKTTTKATTAKTTSSTAKESVSSAVPTSGVYFEVDEIDDEEEESTITTTATVTSTIVVDEPSSSSTAASASSKQMHEEL